MYYLIGIGAIVILALIIFWAIYNKLVGAKNIVAEAFSGIDVQLKKRFELIPNLIEAVKGYNAHEASVLEKIVAERSGSGSSISEAAKADQNITGALRAFRIQIEKYPDLKANTQFLKLMDNLKVVEEELAMSRRYYNGATRDLNTKIESFPGNIVAGVTGFSKAEFYELDSIDERNAPEINLSENS